MIRILNNLINASDKYAVNVKHSHLFPFHYILPALFLVGG